MDLVHSSDGGVFIYPLDCEGLFIQNEVNPETVDQFTGLYDNSGREIYEGDIIKCVNYEDCYYVIEWDVNEVTFCAIRIPEVEYGYKVSPMTKSWFAETKKEVIGNIHDNPELLKQ